MGWSARPDRHDAGTDRLYRVCENCCRRLLLEPDSEDTYNHVNLEYNDGEQRLRNAN